MLTIPFHFLISVMSSQIQVAAHSPLFPCNLKYRYIDYFEECDSFER
jgi:hypothetical protein